MRYVIFVLICAAPLGLVWLAASPPTAAQVPKEVASPVWEYKVLSLSGGNVSGLEAQWQAELNKVGSDGWEISGVVRRTHGGEDVGSMVFLKRPKK